MTIQDIYITDSDMQDPNKKKKMSCLMTKPTNDRVPRKDSDQPGHPPSLIRVFAVRMKKHLVISYEGLDGVVWNSLISKILAHYSLSLKCLLIL